MTVAHHFAGPATTQALDDIHALLATVWADAPHLGADERARFTIITAELVANVVEHGSLGLPTPPTLHLDVEVRGDAIHGRLTDTGHEPPRSAPAGRRFTRDPHEPNDAGARIDGHEPHETPTRDEISALRESGRGLLLIRSSADDLALTRDDGHNRWRYVTRPRVSRPHPR